MFTAYASTPSPEFKGFPKITRLLDQDIVVTEKLDGTNAQIFITEDGGFFTGSRNRWITPEDDNYGFSRWAHENKEDLLSLGVGQHFGEWWGNGIQRGYDMPKKVFSLFNTHRFGHENARPKCCDVVPVVYTGPLNQTLLDAAHLTHSPAALKYGIEYANPEGTMCYLHKAGVYLKNPHSK